MNYYFISGTSSGIGRALVQELTTYPSNRVLGLSRTNTINEDNQFAFQKLDLSILDEVMNFDFPVLDSADKIVLVNNAGTLGEIAYVGQQTEQNIQDVMQVNFTSAALLMNKFISKYQNSPCEKQIINISSGAANSAYDGWANYCSAKAALNMYTQVIHLEQVKQNYPVTVFAIAPGVVDTFMQDLIRKTSNDNFSQIDKFIDLKENGHLYESKEVAKKLVELMTDTTKIPSTISRISL